MGVSLDNPPRQMSSETADDYPLGCGLFLPSVPNVPEHSVHGATLLSNT